jgi:hypothetical protein
MFVVLLGDGYAQTLAIVLSLDDVNVPYSGGLLQIYSNRFLLKAVKGLGFKQIQTT